MAEGKKSVQPRLKRRTASRHKLPMPNSKPLSQGDGVVWRLARAQMAKPTQRHRHRQAKSNPYPRWTSASGATVMAETATMASRLATAQASDMLKIAFTSGK